MDVTPSQNVARTALVYQREGNLSTLTTSVVSITKFGVLPEASKFLFKDGTETDYIIRTTSTIFHPQGGGQPSDTGAMKAGDVVFEVTMVRHDSVIDGQVLHLGHFQDASKTFSEGDEIVQSIDVEKRLLYSRLHTAGHVLGAAVNTLLSKTVPEFAELKASHFPTNSSCEFRGSIPGTEKANIQTQVNTFVAAKLPVEIVWWDEEDFKREGVEMPEHTVEVPKGEKWRVVRIVGAESYPCGGTHVADSGACGAIGVTKISRSKGTSKVSYNISQG